MYIYINILVFNIIIYIYIWYLYIISTFLKVILYKYLLNIFFSNEKLHHKGNVLYNICFIHFIICLNILTI